MFIKSYECRRFAGLKDTSLEFVKGLNVILGPNESGKSSIVDGIHSTLFKNIRLRKSYNKDIEFLYKYMPEPDGDFIDGKLVLQTDNGPYEISKEWGSSESIQLETPNGNILKGEKDINEELARVLSFGESTYSNIVFAKQRDLKAALNNIISNNEVTSEVNNILRMAFMELDGISIDRIQNKIEEEIDNLYKRWDIGKNYPENNRGINNPYKNGLGTIIQAYYNKESLKLAMESANRAEEEFETISNQIKVSNEEKDLVNKEKSDLEDLEDDVSQRAILNSEIKTIKKELEALMETNREWPKVDAKIIQLGDKLKELDNKRELVLEEKKNIEKLKTRQALEKKLGKIEEIQKQNKRIAEELSEIPPINGEDIEKLSQLQRNLLTCQTAMEAGKMIGEFKKSTDKSLYVSKDFEDRLELESHSRIEANGLIKISYADEFEMVIKTGEIDFEELISRKKSIEDQYKNLLETLRIDSIESGKLNLKEIGSKEKDKLYSEKELELVLDGSSKEEILEEFKGLEEIKVYRDLDDIEVELEENQRDKIEYSANLHSETGKVKSWIEKYESHDNLFEIVIEERSDLKNKEEKLESLKPLPEDFQSVDEFRNRLSYLKGRSRQIQEELDDLSESYYEARSNLSDDSYEELKKAYLQAEKTFNTNINRGKKLLQIEEVFYSTKDKLDKNPMDNLVKEFSRILKITTKGVYEKSHIDEDFNIKLVNPNGQIPIDLLSAGTYDCVSLALRFSLLKHVFTKGGYLVLDDCLVDLDPLRKAQSIDLIKELANDYQIIFTTCDPETAKMLEGNLIQL